MHMQPSGYALGCIFIYIALPGNINLVAWRAACLSIYLYLNNYIANGCLLSGDKRVNFKYETYFRAHHHHRDELTKVVV